MKSDIMKGIYVLTCQIYERNTIGAYTNLKELHKAMIEIQEDQAPTYNQVRKDFSSRKQYVSLSIGYYNEDDYKSLDVTYTELNATNR